MHRPALLLICFVWGCFSQPSRPLLLARHLDASTSTLHVALRSWFLESPFEEDDKDARLLEQVGRLDRADEDLAAKIQQLETAKASGGNVHEARLQILKELDQVCAGVAAVVDSLEARPAHDAVREALEPLSEQVSAIRVEIEIGTE
jgi:hypothetical protein